ncbi:hypothetical protein NIES3806_05240 [Microcystis aeruginosa NIES-3806]|uniref:Uncharacterized protein n=2 Tax=Microcystis aeruginosa TaxID=1126 RepID=A0A6H9GCP9_MICAE|nr:hypothetical protein [Microcystis aeruginosa]GCA78104.1 hypothetical protein MiTs_00082 [Microcystis aeruginosa NIES-2521]GCL47744.1 hypothetical protein NIES3787_34540 [Microcystis aeruginosa NIES-3787]GCL53194.1 hypothetical protein NIES3806_05240 [Microcystis aeruginosa NIES-3806]
MTTYKVKPVHEQGLDVTIDVWDDQTIDDTPGRWILTYAFLLYS